MDKQKEVQPPFAVEGDSHLEQVAKVTTRFAPDWNLLGIMADQTAKNRVVGGRSTDGK
jgi:hypothetical protein